MSELLPQEALTPAEETRLAELEAVVERGMRTFVEVGTALAEIRDARLYRETHATFERYCRERLGFADSRARQLVAAAETVTTVTAAGLPAPANERQARELVPVLREDEQSVVEVWRQLRNEYGEEVTADRIKRLVRRRLERVHREKSRAVRLAEGAPVFGEIDVRHGDFREVLGDVVEAADAIVCDPPYERSWIERDAGDFAEAAARMLKPAGTLVVMFGQLLHYELKPYLDAALRHRWTGVYLMPGYHAKMWHAKVATGWKPILIYVRKDAPAWEYLTDDVFVSDAADKAFHEWGQSVSGTTQLVERFTRPGDLVVDPFLGGGTTAVVCQQLGRRFVGCDVDHAAITTVRARLTSAEELAS